MLSQWHQELRNAETRWWEGRGTEAKRTGREEGVLGPQRMYPREVWVSKGGTFIKTERPVQYLFDMSTLASRIFGSQYWT